MTDRLKELADAGVSIWLDDLNRERLTSGSLKRLIDESHVTGVTTNPTIFAAALADGEAYAADVKRLKGESTSLADTIITLTSDDVRNACDLFREVNKATDGYDGRVSIEVDPTLANDTDATVEMARRLWQTVDRPNLLVKIPATLAGLPAITAVVAEGISVNVTLIFSGDRYEEVMDAWMSGLEQAAEKGHDLSQIHSVASFFVSRVDSEVDKRLEAIGTDEALALRGKAALANARLAYELFTDVLKTPRWQELAAKGANVQRPLWASTGVKNPDYDDTMYVRDLVVRGVVNTMPEKTMQAYADHGETRGDQVTTHIDEARRVSQQLHHVGIVMADVYDLLEREGVDKFVKSGEELNATVQKAIDEA